MGESNGVGATQGHHFLDGESSGGEDLDDLRHGHGRSGEIAFNSGSHGNATVLATEVDIVVGAAKHGEEVARGDGKDIGAGNSVGAGKLESGLGADDDIEAIAGEGKVDVGVALGFVEGSGGDEDGGVTGVGEAVVEEEAEGGAGGGGAGDLLVGNGVLDDVSELGAGFAVIIQ
ncbi:hypothetical protein QN277_020669 [Acacia crassicarpa]|uniref:Uncharacterized protein n=1 Tax=Acacia crassicarpa TaxID=499986 RepID=A0AAE1JQ28_9FABA|nr:hypothetical protein QN277_020669 [Acacia crassicarpa]